MLDSVSIKQIMIQIKTVNEQNDNDMFYLDTHHQQNQSFHQFMHDKMQALQEIIQITIHAMYYIQDVQDQKYRLDKSNELLKQDLNHMCDINMKLEERIEELNQEIAELKQQFKDTSNYLDQIYHDRIIEKQQFLSVKQNIAFKKQLQYHQDRLEDFMPSPVHKRNSTQNKIQPIEIDDFSPLTREKTYDSVSRTEPIPQYKIKIKNKLSLLSLESLQNVSVRSGMYSDRWVLPVRLNEELPNLEFNQINSIFEIENDEMVNETKETDDEISLRLHKTLKAQKKSSIFNCKNSEQSKKINESICVEKITENLKQPDMRSSFFGNFTSNLSKIHNFCYQKIVRSRIDPKRSAQKRGI